MNKRGQALVEFVIILPVLLCIVLAMIDFGLILYNKNKLENKLNDVVNMVQNNENEDKINEYLKSDDKNSSYEVINSDKYKKVKLKTQVNIVTPGLNIVLSNPYKIEVDRIVYER